MKRTAGTMVLLAGLGGCASTDGPTRTAQSGKPFGMAYSGVEVPGVVGPNGEPIHRTGATTARGAAPAKSDADVQQAAGFAKIGGGSSSSGCADGSCNIHTPGVLGSHRGGSHGGGQNDPYAYGPMGSGLGTLLGQNGIMPVPGMGPAGAVAAVGAIGAGGMGPVITNQRTSVKFTNPANMKVSWLGPTGYTEPALQTPFSFNFMQGNVYRLRLTNFPNPGGRSTPYYPTLEVRASTAKSITYLAHNTVPIGFTADDFERVNAGNLVVKVIYLPDAQFQDLAALAGPEEVVSAQLQPGEDPEVEAARRGTILAVVRIGNIDLENPFSPSMDAAPGGMARPNSMPVMQNAAPAVPGPTLMPAPSAVPIPGMPVPIPAPKKMDAPPAPGKTSMLNYGKK